MSSSQCRHLDNVLVGGACRKVGVALGSGHRRRGDADDGCGDLTSLAVEGRLLVHTHVETGAAGAEGLDVNSAQLL